MEDTFEKMLVKLSPKIRSIAHRLNGRNTYFCDDDLYQEAAIHLFVRYTARALENKTDSYVLQGCYYHLKNYLRGNLDKAKLVSLSEPIDDEQTPLEEIIPAAPQPRDEDAYRLMPMDLPDDCTLSDVEIKILDLTLQGLTTREIGERLGVSHVMIVKRMRAVKEKYRRSNSFHAG